MKADVNNSTSILTQSEFQTLKLFERQNQYILSVPSSDLVYHMHFMMYQSMFKSISLMQHIILYIRDS